MTASTVDAYTTLGLGYGWPGTGGIDPGGSVSIVSPSTITCKLAGSTRVVADSRSLTMANVIGACGECTARDRGAEQQRGRRTSALDDE